MIVVAKTIPSLKTREEQLKVNKHPMRSINSISNRTLVPSIQTLKQTYNKSDRQKEEKKHQKRHTFKKFTRGVISLDL